MNPLKNRLLLTLLTLTCLSFAMTRTSVAKRIEFPYNDPTFSLEFPSKWTFEDEKDGSINCDPGDDSGYAFSILILDKIHDQKELKAALPKLVKGAAEIAKIKDLKLGDIETGKNGSGISFIGLRGDGTFEGTDFVVMIHAFEAKKGKFFAIVTAGSAKEDKRHEKQYDEITASIDPVD